MTWSWSVVTSSAESPYPDKRCRMPPSLTRPPSKALVHERISRTTRKPSISGTNMSSPEIMNLLVLYGSTLIS